MHAGTHTEIDAESVIDKIANGTLRNERIPKRVSIKMILSVGDRCQIDVRQDGTRANAQTADSVCLCDSEQVTVQTESTIGQSVLKHICKCA
jgi:predicted subunit of tRNA(5-methylaminomethyl-2-thiouridylate) methyltransferase